MRIRAKLVIILLILAGCFAAYAETASSVTNAIVSLEGKSIEHDNAVGADGHIHSVQSPALILMPAGTTNPKGTILLFPGGGYHILAIKHEGTSTAKFLNGQGFDVAILEYSIASGDKTRDMALKDALTACRLIRKDHDKLGLNGKRFGIMGYSAGGHLAARTTASLDANEQPDDLILVYPAYLNETTPGTRTMAVRPPAKPTARLFAIIAANDNAKWVSSCREYSAVWKATGGEAHLEILADGGHGFGMKTDLPGATKQWPEMLAKFLAAEPLPGDKSSVTNLQSNAATSRQ